MDSLDERIIDVVLEKKGWKETKYGYATAFELSTDDYTFTLWDDQDDLSTKLTVRQRMTRDAITYSSRDYRAIDKQFYALRDQLTRNIDKTHLLSALLE
jgi:hypothetical protein